MIKIDFSSLSTVPCPLCGCEKFEFEATRIDSGRITKCSRCGHFYLNPPIPPGVLEEVYAESYSHPDQQFKGEIEDWFSDPQGPYISALRSLQGSGYSLAGKRVFEIGAGAGRFLVECRKQGALVEGLDFYPKAVAIAKQYFDLDLTCCSIEQSGSIPGDTYDLVFAFEVIEHLYKPGELVRFAHRILKKNGLFVLSTPNFDIFKKAGNNCFSPALAQEHLHYFTLETLGSSLGDGFGIERMTTVNPLLFGERQRSIAIHNKALWGMWVALRRIPLLSWLKERMILLLNRVKQKEDLELRSGMDIVCFARKK